LNPFQWSTERVDITAQEAIQPADNLASNATKQVAGKIAQGWLLKQLANGPRLAKELTALASEQINIKYDTLNRARKFLGIESIKLEDNSNQWSLPKKEKKK
jgi:NADH:ubiquinone oxidoreductase subunit F (NADH-binding)